MYAGLICPDCGVPLVPFGGEDICTRSCQHCGAHECDCEATDDGEWDPDDGAHYDDTGRPIGGAA